MRWRAPFTPGDLADPSSIVFGITVTSIDQHARDLRAAGFADVTSTDLSPDWAPLALPVWTRTGWMAPSGSRSGSNGRQDCRACPAAQQQ